MGWGLPELAGVVVGGRAEEVAERPWWLNVYRMVAKRLQVEGAWGGGYQNLQV